MASIILGMGVGLCSLSQAQMGGVGGGGMGGEMPNAPGTAFGGATDPSSIQIVEGIRIIPSVRIAEQYDSNVFFAPKSQLQGLSPGDIVTTIAPQVRGLFADHKQLVKMNAVVGAVGNYYVNNTGLSYVGANVGVGLDLSNLVSQWRPGARWMVSDTYLYSPQPPAFLIGDQSGEQTNPLVAGFQAVRTKTSSNSVNTLFEFPLYNTVRLTGSYTNSFIRYGGAQVPQVTTLISQDIQAYTAGFSMQTSFQDTVRIDFIGNDFDQGGVGEFKTRGGALGWAHKFSTVVSFNANGGVQELSGQLNGVRLSSVIAPFGSLAILWKDPATSIALAYRSGIVPSFQFQSASLLSHSVSFNLTQNTPVRDLAGLLGANYTTANEYGSNSGGALSWATVGGTVGLLYRPTQKMFLTLIYSYLNVDNVFGGNHFAYDKHLVQLSLTQAVY
jgi:hypothetical protein